MNKKEFIDSLRARLDILEQSEIDDIVSEYKEHIEEKVKSGIAEEDAVKDLGSIDEIVSETLAAYKIKDKYSKGDDVADTLGRAFSQFAGVFAKILDNISKKDSKDIIKVIFEIIIILLLIAVLKLPVEVLKSFGSELFSLLFFPLGNILNVIWIFVLEVSYFILSIALLFTIIKNRYLTKEEISEIKKNFNDSEMFTRGKDDIKRAANDLAKDFKEVGKDIAKDFNAAAHEIDREFTPRKVEEVKKRNMESYEYEKEDNFVFRIFEIIVKVFLFLFMIPVFFMMIGFIVAFAAIIGLMINGVFLIGPTIILAGLVIFSTFLFEVMIKGLQSKIISSLQIVSSIVISFIFIGVGATFTAGEFAIADYSSTAPKGVPTLEVTTEFEYEDVPKLFEYRQAKYIIDDEMKDNVKVVVTYHKGFTNPKVVEVDDYLFIEEYQITYSGKKMFDIIKRDIKNKTFHNYSLLFKPTIKVYLSNENYKEYKQLMNEMEEDRYSPEFNEDFEEESA